MRVSINKLTGKMIEPQSGGETHPDPNIDDEEYALMNLETLKQNAINAGHLKKDIEVKWVTDEEWAVIQEANKPVPTYTELRRAEYPPIGDQLDEILRFLDESGMVLTPGLAQTITDWKQVKVDIPKA